MCSRAEDILDCFFLTISYSLETPQLELGVSGCSEEEICLQLAFLCLIGSKTHYVDKTLCTSNKTHNKIQSSQCLREIHFYKESFMGHFTLSYEQLEHQSRVFCLWQRYPFLNLHNENHTVQWNRPHLQLYCTALTQRLIPDAYSFIVCQTLLGFVPLPINAVMTAYLLACSTDRA